MKSCNLKKELQKLAEKYENIGFLKEDPSQFMHRFTNKTDQEIVAFISAMLAFGNRKNILEKIEEILKQAGNNPTEWIKKGTFEKSFPESEKKFYRFFSYKDMRALFSELRQELIENESFGESIHKEYKKNLNADISKIIGSKFSKSSIVPKGKDSACKRIWLFMRWMVRTNSPVDLGIWTWYSQNNLIIPLDTHVLKESQNFGFTTKATASFKTAKEITEKLKEIFPEDPCKGDFALFGKGIEDSKR